MKRASTSADVRASHSADGAVLIDIRQGIIFSLNTTGSKVWSELERGASPEEIAVDFSDEYGMPREQALADILNLIRSLEDKHLVVTAP